MRVPEKRIVSSRKYEKADPWPDLVVAMLSVNKYPLAKTFGLFEDLSACGLFDPINYVTRSESEIGEQLRAAGYDRGALTTMLFAPRLASLRVLAVECSRSQEILATGTREEVAALLKQVNGVGPRVLENFLLLRGAGHAANK
jgi:hypothetical protein